MNHNEIRQNDSLGMHHDSLGNKTLWNNMRNVVHHRERNTKYRIVACYIHKNTKKIKLSSKKVKGQYLLLQRKELVESQCSREQGGFLCLFFFWNTLCNLVLNIWMSRIFLSLNISVVYPCISNNWQVCKLGLIKGYQSMTVDYCSEMKREEFSCVHLLLLFSIFQLGNECRFCKWTFYLFSHAFTTQNSLPSPKLPAQRRKSFYSYMLSRV